MIYKVPTVEEIYNEYHRQTFHAVHGIWPKPIKNFNRVNSDTAAKEYLLRFQNMVSRNRDMIDWKLYIEACAQLLKQRFELKLLGSLAGNKLYRNYMSFMFSSSHKADEIYEEILGSLRFFKEYVSGEGMTSDDYYNIDVHTIPLALKHIYAGTVSMYFYAAMPLNESHRRLCRYSNEPFLELFDMNREDFYEKYIRQKHENILKYPKIRELCERFEIHFKTGK